MKTQRIEHHLFGWCEVIDHNPKRALCYTLKDEDGYIWHDSETGIKSVDSPVIDGILKGADPDKMKSAQLTTQVLCSILNNLDIAASKQNTKRKDYKALLEDVYQDVTLRMAAMGVDKTK